MKNELPKRWVENLEVLDIAFQPILNIHTGDIFGVEALLRNYQDIGYKTIFDLFDDIYLENILYSFDIALREKAIKKFTKIKNYNAIKLFYNLDNRLFEMPNFESGNTAQIIKNYNILKENICFEISERHELKGESTIDKTLHHYKDESFSIAIDDFGIGYSGYKLLYDVEPDVIKIDRFFLTNIEKDAKKKLMVRNIIHLAVQLGIKLIAEGVETKEELLTCRDIGCHLVQGYFVQHPTKETSEILETYPHIAKLVKRNSRSNNVKENIKSNLDKIDSLKINTNMSDVFDYFKKHQKVTIVPVINSNKEPVGILLEEEVKDLLYSPYGRSLLLNNGSKKSKLKNLIKPCGSTDINSDTSTIIELFSNDTESKGIIITKNSKYYGFLSARSIINIMNAQNILHAREQNPLTKLPGNSLIEKYIDEAIHSKETYIMCYFDLDNFKAFNDVYGFRNGDRVIQLFSDILRKNLNSSFFKAHIGGDDFFVGVKCSNETTYSYSFESNCSLDIENCSEESSCAKILSIEHIIHKFINDVKEFYTPDDKLNGYIVSKDRDGEAKKFDLLSVSAAIVEVHKKSKQRDKNLLDNVFSAQKKVAKHSPKHFSISTLL
ncbi:GGDEF domain-containing protein [Sulfurimonas lithotrophica]|uniref:GGDEF domain-containing protein n=1 Tax=Sulfurimonas lithotrophica TaxID=2590022 RepID=A0A5P8P347_9BACT|nr:GGDEF domain-containing protein [Sulfurimonas lithotrophica]QFR50152.1 GGDEF domain-containing protein [Sulfurimonas lithotrophica]